MGLLAVAGQCLHQESEAGFSNDQTKLKWQLGQLGPTKLDSLKKRKNLLNGNELSFWFYSAQVPNKFCLGTVKQASKVALFG